jgi:hypothetical protein
MPQRMTEMTRTEPRWLSHRYSGEPHLRPVSMHWEERRRRVLRRGSRHGRHCVEGYGCDIWKLRRARFLNSRSDCRIVLFVRLLAEMSDKIE